MLLIFQLITQLMQPIQGNASWNQSFANGLYIATGNQSIYDGLINNASYLSTYNATYDSMDDNSSWNQSFADTLYADISVTGDNTTLDRESLA